MIFLITKTSLEDEGGVETLVVTIAPPPIMAGEIAMPSPHRMPYLIPAPTADQIARYKTGKTITLMPVEPTPAPAAQPAPASSATAAPTAS